MQEQAADFLGLHEQYRQSNTVPIGLLVSILLHGSKMLSLKQLLMSGFHININSALKLLRLVYIDSKAISQTCALPVAVAVVVNSIRSL